MPRVTPLRARIVVVAAVLLSASGCTTISQYIHNGFKVGPNLDVPDGDTAPEWLDATDVRVRSDNDETSRWWTVFKDPTLDELIAHASAQNLTLREAGFRVLQSCAQLGISIGNLFPQQQGMGGTFQNEGYSRVANSSVGYQEQFYYQNTFGWNLAWEIDFWGRFRRAVTAARATLDASAANYNDVLVILMGDVASNYVIFRTLQQRLEYVQANIDLQKRILEIAERRVKAGARGAADLEQARANLAQTAAQTPQLQLLLRQASNRLCVLLGMHPIDLEQEMRPGPIPTAPASVAVGIPAQLLEPPRCAPRRVSGGGASRADRHRHNRFLSGDRRQRDCRLLVGKHRQALHEPRVDRVHRACVSMEAAELRANQAQRKSATGQVPGARGGLSADGDPGQRRSRRRTGDIPASPGASQAIRGERDALERSRQSRVEGLPARGC